MIVTQDTHENRFYFPQKKSFNIALALHVQGVSKEGLYLIFQYQREVEFIYLLLKYTVKKYTI